MGAKAPCHRLAGKSCLFFPVSRIAVIGELNMIFKAIDCLTREHASSHAAMCWMPISSKFLRPKKQGGIDEAFPDNSLEAERVHF